MASVVAHMRSLPPATKAVMAATSALSLGTMLVRYRGAADTSDWTTDAGRYVQARPGLLLSYPWTILTTSFVEPGIVLLVYGLGMLATVGGFLEQQWGTRGYVNFLLVLAVAPTITASLAVFILHLVRGTSDVLYTTTVSGLAGILAGFTVGLKQLAPDYTVKLFRGSFGFRVNDLPGFYTLVFPIVFTLMGDLGGVLLVNVGFFEAFVYLRFFKRTGSVRGDRSEAFAFSSFFPEFVQPVVRRVSTAVYSAAVACRVITSEEGYQQAIDLEAVGPVSPDAEPVASGPVQFAELDAVVASDGPSLTEDSDAERRRALATKALDMRLGSSSVP
ncbi:hypothetical protein LPJ64_004757 [Coemansia asiatica]|uniref:Uncharacterized protein n=1 Tax=Coemansia asiatica TaxID=1052880 RepID=A0A9W7XFL7_9FUNG|nr:hypothetical protein LPJ64_004757 [Coemansia asiatica]